MSSSSDSEDENLKLVLGAADTNFLSDSLFNVKKDHVIPPPADLPKSQRYLQDNDTSAVDFVPSESVQKLMSKKLALLVEDKVEFTTDSVTTEENNKRTRKSRLKLLSDFDCYVKSYEDYEYTESGPRIKPTIQQRSVDSDEQDEESKLMKVAVDGEYILSRKETENWSEKSKGKVFRYKHGGGKNKVQHLIETENEFTKIRRKNKWNESKIRETKFPVK